MNNYILYSGAFFTPIAVVLSYNFNKIYDYLIKSLQYWPGEGEIYKKNNLKTKATCYYIRNPDRDIRLNYVKSPYFDMNIAIFKKDIDIKNQMFVSKDYFDVKYAQEEKIIVPNQGMGFIDDIYHTRNIKKGKLYGYIRCLTEDKVFMFIVEEGNFDLKIIFKDYEDEILNGVD